MSWSNAITDVLTACLGLPSPLHAKIKWLDAQQHQQLAEGFKSLNIDKIRFTGGEPLLRPDLLAIITAWRDAFPKAVLALTTNGDKMMGREASLKAAGLNQVTFHLDTLRPERYGDLMGPGNFDSILATIRRARNYFTGIKINAVLQKGVNDDEVFDFLAFAKEHDVQVRFIELMDTGSAPVHVQQTFLSQRELLARLEKDQPVSHLGRTNRTDPAANFHLPEADFSFGMIASDTEPFARIAIACGCLPTACCEVVCTSPRASPYATFWMKICQGNTWTPRFKKWSNFKSSFHPSRVEAGSHFPWRKWAANATIQSGVYFMTNENKGDTAGQLMGWSLENGMKTKKVR